MWVGRILESALLNTLSQAWYNTWRESGVGGHTSHPLPPPRLLLPISLAVLGVQGAFRPAVPRAGALGLYHGNKNDKKTVTEFWVAVNYLTPETG